MAGSDCKWDTQTDIANFIEQKIKSLLEEDMSDFDDPAWVQSAELFDELVVPCKCYLSDELIVLGDRIVKEAETHGSRVAHQSTPRVYNKKMVTDYSETVNSIKKWIANQQEQS